VVAAATAGEGLVHFLVPPYLDSVHFPVGVIGVLVATGALAALASRVPAGLLYRGGRARALLVGTMCTGAVAALLIPTATDPLAFAALRALSGFCYGVASTVNLARFIDAIPPGRDRASAMGYFSAALAVGFMIGNGCTTWWARRSRLRCPGRRGPRTSGARPRAAGAGRGGTWRCCERRACCGWRWRGSCLLSCSRSAERSSHCTGYPWG
jgi:MFS family permease